MTTLVRGWHVRPALAAAVRVTVPVKPLTAVTVIVWVPVAPGANGPTVVAADGAIEKSTTWNVITAVVCETPPLVPVTVTVASPDAELAHVSVAVCGDAPKVTLVAMAHANTPAGEEADTDRFTTPVKPLTAVRVIVEEPEEPTRIWVGVTGPAAIVKSTTWNVIAAVVCDRAPIVPVTVTT
jgi:hypothetical protein